MNVLKILKIGSSIAGLGAISTLGAYKLSTKTIKGKAEILLPENETNEKIWKKAKDNWSKNKNNKNFFKTLEQDTWESFKHKCTSFYNDTYSSWFENKKEELLKEIKEVCVLDIKETIEDGKLLEISKGDNGDKNKSFFENKFSLTTNDPELKGIISKGNDSWKELESWCEASYNDKYTGQNGKWKLVKTYCTKP